MAVYSADRSFRGLFVPVDRECGELGEDFTELFPDPFPILDLRDYEDFKEWRFDVERNLWRLNLEGFIKGTERPPEWCPPEEDNPIARRKFRRFGDRSYYAFRVIYDSAKPILPELERKGFWSFGKTGHDNSHDPKVLWDSIERWHTAIPYTYKCKYLKELSNINRDQFEDLDAYISRAWLLHWGLWQVNLAVPDDVQMGFLIDGLRAHHISWAMDMEKRLEDGKLTFGTLLFAMQDLRAREETMEQLEERLGNNTADANCQCNDDNNNKNNKRQQNNKRRRNSQGHRQQHNGVTKRYSTHQ